MNAESASSAPPFTLIGVKWKCWVIEDGQAYEWRSSCGKFSVTRNARTFVGKREGRIIGKGYSTIREAMSAAQGVMR